MTSKSIYPPIIGDGENSTPVKKSIGVDDNYNSTELTPAQAGKGLFHFPDTDQLVYSTENKLIPLLSDKKITDFTNLLINGDSTSIKGEHLGWWAISFTAKNNVDMVFAGDLEQPCPANFINAAVGYLSYRSSDSSFRWKAPGDAYGPWTKILGGTRGWLESATSGMRLTLGHLGPSTAGSHSLTDWADATITFPSAGSQPRPWVVSYSRGPSTILKALRIKPEIRAYNGVGSLDAKGLVASLPYINEEFKGVGLDITSIGVNDASGNDDLAELNANLALYRQYVQSRIDHGRTLCFIGIHGYSTGGASYNSWGSTFLTGVKLDAARQIHALFKQFEKEFYGRFFFVDTATDFLDTGYLDYRPLVSAGNYVLVDGVHPSEWGGQLIAFAVKEKLKNVIEFGTWHEYGDSNLVGNTAGNFIGTTHGATTTGGASGTVPTGLEGVGGGAYGDCTCVFSVVNRSSKVSTYAEVELPTSYNAIKMVMANGATAGAHYKIYGANAYFSGTALGIKAGDVVRGVFYLDRLSADLAAIEMSWIFSGMTINPEIYCPYDGLSSQVYGHKAFSETMAYFTPWFVVPSDFEAGDYLIPTLRAYPKQGTSGVELYIGPIVLEKK